MFKLFSHGFSGGVHPKTFKSLTTDKPIDHDFWPSHVYLPLQERDGAVLMPLVEVGDRVFRGQLIAKGRSDRVSPIHSPVNGIVINIAPHITAHPAKIIADTIVIRANEDRNWGTPAPLGAFHQLEPEVIIERIQAAGIVGLGGAGFPTAQKLKSALMAKVETLIINGGECEPYLTSDDVTMQTHAAEVVGGIKLMQQACGAKNVIVGIEDNKPQAYAEMLDAASEEPSIEIRRVPSIYPMGSAKQLIKTLIGKEVPLGGRSSHIGVVVNNIATARSVYHAVRFQRPLVSRIVTVSGMGIGEPRNVEVPLGTRVQDLLNYCGGVSESAERLILGGPMMGQIVSSLEVPLDKMVGGLLALTEEEIISEYQHQQCIRCGQCVRACPMSLMPFQMAAYTKVSDFKRAEELGVRNCLSCGACSYVCPSSIPLVQYFMHAKGVISSNWQKERKSQQAKRLTEAKRHRMEEEALAKLAEKQAKRPARVAANVTSANPTNTHVTSTDATGASGKPARPSRPGRPARPSVAAQATVDPTLQSVTTQVSDQAQASKQAGVTRPVRPVRPQRPARPQQIARPSHAVASTESEVLPEAAVALSDTSPVEATTRPTRPARPPRPARPARAQVEQKETTLSEENQG
ncbi:electron transport complex subunit RsxC [Vibrio porteresiae]|uniref:Ion-translocating oxidoreductase complex subunit C n=1 Tax=Vibrio porteresiae DSM 19223 TaxID=1123496 RepID=A0ABZ0QIA4_9VIBR|nr:electron transport complex subunit RsxC [Vibrio porteresiae]WPC76229.1 electron transport complex subunit RsxC [Vibrio porteresiae DSM 19223]